MNKGRIGLGVGLIVLSVVIFFVSTSAGWRLVDFEGDDNSVNIIKITENVDDIHSIKAEGMVDVHISISDTERVEYIFNDERFTNQSTFDKGVLKINFHTKKKGFKLFGHGGSGVEVYVSVRSLKYIEMNGIGSIKTSGSLETDELKLVNEGTGSMKIDVAAKQIIGWNAGVGSMKIKGAADSAILSNQGVGSLDADKLIVQVMDAKNDGVGSMEVYAEKKIALRNSGVGSIQYSGNAEVTSQRSEGVGRISKR